MQQFHAWRPEGKSTLIRSWRLTSFGDQGFHFKDVHRTTRCTAHWECEPVPASGLGWPSEAGVVPGVSPDCACVGLSSLLSLRVRPAKTSLRRLLILLLLVSSTLAFGPLPAKSPLLFLRCSLRRRKAPMRSSVEALGRWRRERISRNAVRRRCDVSPSVFSGGASPSKFWESYESRDCTGRRSTRHSGQVPDTFRSHGSTHSGWNLWSHGKTRRSWPFSKSSVQMEHPRLSSDEALSVPIAPAAAAAADCAGAMPDCCSSAKACVVDVDCVVSVTPAAVFGIVAVLFS